MKTHILITLFVLLSMNAFSQQTILTIGGGYSFANIEDIDVKGTGYRINGLLEFNPMGGKFAHGLSVGFIGLKAEETVGLLEISSAIKSVPIYYAPKLMFGSDKLKVFIKGALGAQFAWIDKEGVADPGDTFDSGFYTGGGAGVMLFIKSNIFINAEYEIAWASNNWCKDGWMNTAGGGIGFIF